MSAPRDFGEWLAAHRHELTVVEDHKRPGRWAVGYPSRRPAVTPNEYLQRDMTREMAEAFLAVILKIGG